MSFRESRTDLLPERMADMLAENDACGPGPVSRDEYVADARALLGLIQAEGCAVLPQADLLRIVKEAAELRSALRAARHSMCDAHVLLSPGMRAGTAESKARLAEAIKAVNEALELEGK